MSETQEGYGAQSTPDMGKSYPPQTGDLLGSYIARLSARVRELEAASTEQSAYQKSLEMRIERLESRQDDTDLVIRTRVVTMANNLSSLDQQPEPTEAPAVATPPEQEHVSSNRKPGLCDRCRSSWAHGVMGGVHWCSSGLINEEFGCREFVSEAPAVTTPTVTRERTHGRYGTRNLTKTKPDHIVDANKKVCATCGHGAGLHVCHKSANGIVNYWTCNAGPLGQPCRCTGYKPVATEG